jgi:hypothetical protein
MWAAEGSILNFQLITFFFLALFFIALRFFCVFLRDLRDRSLHFLMRQFSILHFPLETNLFLLVLLLLFTNISPLRGNLSHLCKSIFSVFSVFQVFVLCICSCESQLSAFSRQFIPAHSSVFYWIMVRRAKQETPGLLTMTNLAFAYPLSSVSFSFIRFSRVP